MKYLVPILYLGLLAAAVPWFWQPGDHALMFGLPRWVVVAIAVSACVSVLTLCVLVRPWPHEGGDGNE